MYTEQQIEALSAGGWTTFVVTLPRETEGGFQSRAAGERGR